MTTATSRPSADGPPIADFPALAGYRIHPAANLFPMMSAEEISQVADDIRANGQQEPIWLDNGAILDGRNRLVACVQADVKPAFADWVPRSGTDTPYAFVWSKNGPRRHLTGSQRAAIAARMAEQIRAEHARIKEEHRQRVEDSRRQAAQTRPSGVTRTPGTQLEFTSSEPTPAPVSLEGAPASPFNLDSKQLRLGKSREQAASVMSVSPTIVNDAQNVLRADPDTFAAVERGEMTLNTAQARLVEQAHKEGRLDELPLRPSVKKSVLEGLNKPIGKQPPVAKPRIRLRKFSDIASSRTRLRIDLTCGNPAVAEEWLNRLQDDPKVLDVTYEVIDPT